MLISKGNLVLRVDEVGRDTNPDHNDEENTGKRVDEVGMDYSDGGLSDYAPSQTKDSNEEVAETKERFYSFVL